MYYFHLDGSICQGGVAGGVIIGPRPSYGPEGGDKVEVMEPGKKKRILETCGEKWEHSSEGEL